MNQKPKRSPSLADLYLATGTMDHMKEKWLPSDKPFVRWINYTQDKLRVAKRFVLDEQAITYVGELCRDAPEAIAYAQEFAIPPFENMFIEFDSRVLWHVVNDHLGRSQPPGGWGDRMVGFLVQGPRVFTVTGADPDVWGGEYASLTPMVYHLNQPFKSNVKVKLPPKFEKVLQLEDPIDLLFWGSAFNQIRDDPAMVRALRGQHSIEIIRALTESHVDALFHGSMGDLRSFLAIILLLNRTRDIEYVEVPMQPGRMVGRRAMTLTGHRIIKINLSPVKEIIRLGKRAGVTFRSRSDVKGAYHRNKLARLAAQTFGICKGNTHDWQEDVTRKKITRPDYRRWECLKCGGLMWWKPEHKRGNEFAGTIDSSYRVTRKRPPPEAHV